MKLPLPEKFLWDLYHLFTKEVEPTFGSSPLNPYALKNMLTGKGKNTDVMQAKILKQYRAKHGAKRFANLIYYLKKRGYVEAKGWGARQGILITKIGIDKIVKIHERKKMSLLLREDEKWQMVIFDIIEQQRRVRDRFRHALKSLGYRQLQKSIWVSPYDVEDRTKAIISSFNLEDQAKLFLIDSIEEVELKDRKVLNHIHDRE